MNNSSVFISEYNTPIGRVTLAANGNKLCGLWFAGQKYFRAGIPDDAQIKNVPIFVQTVLWLDKYFSGARPDISELDIAPHGTDFQKRVWRELCNIPYGQTVTYGQIAAKIGNAPRAVGGAIGRNPISIIIPCHRVIGVNHNLVGYAGGPEIKKQLLQHEGAI